MCHVAGHEGHCVGCSGVMQLAHDQVSNVCVPLRMQQVRVPVVTPFACRLVAGADGTETRHLPCEQIESDTYCGDAVVRIRQNEVARMLRMLGVNDDNRICHFIYRILGGLICSDAWVTLYLQQHFGARFAAQYCELADERLRMQSCCASPQQSSVASCSNMESSSVASCSADADEEGAKMRVCVCSCRLLYFYLLTWPIILQAHQLVARIIMEVWVFLAGHLCVSHIHQAQVPA